MSGDPENMHSAGADLHHEQDVQATQEDRVNVEEVAGQQSGRLRAQERSPRGIGLTRTRTNPAGAQDAPNGGLTEAMAQPREFAMNPAIAPAGILPSEPKHDLAYLSADRRSARSIRISPLPHDQTAMPGQQRARSDDPTQPQLPG